MWLKIPPSKAYSTVPWSSIYYKKQKPGKAFYSKYVLELEKKAQERDGKEHEPLFPHGLWKALLVGMDSGVRWCSIA